jgi:uncharacterized membrane protein YgdD (TMEM256/DUF423 family)
MALGALLLALAVAAGAFGAHALADRIEPRALQLWETAARYLAYAGFGTVLAGLVAERRSGRGATWAARLLATGGIVFGGAVGALALGGPRILGAVTPLGGVALIAGFLTLAVAAARE